MSPWPGAVTVHLPNARANRGHRRGAMCKLKLYILAGRAALKNVKE